MDDIRMGFENKKLNDKEKTEMNRLEHETIQIKSKWEYIANKLKYDQPNTKEKPQEQ